jgi:5-methylcytosine-specific restriction endonuclease McrA
MAWSAKQRMTRVNRLRKRDGDRCWLCHDKFTAQRPATIDHAIPKGRGGTNHLSNLRLAHASCNRDRGMIVKTPPKAYQVRLAKLSLPPLGILELTAEMRVVAAEPQRLLTAA